MLREKGAQHMTTVWRGSIMRRWGLCMIHSTAQKSKRASKCCRNIDLGNMSMYPAIISHPPSLPHKREISPSSYS